MSQMGTSSRGPLDGIVVLDLSRALAGPYCTLQLANLGARVIKVEVPGRGDDSRHIGPFNEGRSAYFASINYGKESIALDLKAANDRAIFEALLPQIDVLVENFRPGAMERLGYGWDTLRLRHPKLIYAAVSGFGHTGPWSDRPAYDMVVQAMGGIMSITGHPGGSPTRVGVSLGDIAAGLFTAIGINAALVHRAGTGEATKVDVAMFDCQLAIVENAIARFGATGEIPGPTGARHPSIAPFEPYSATDGHVVVAAGNDALFRKTCKAIDRPDLATDPRFESNTDRVQNVEMLRQEIEQEFARMPVKHWLAVLEAEGVPSGPLNNISQALQHPQVAARRMLVDVEDGASLKLAGNPVKISCLAEPISPRKVPVLDGDREVIFRDFGLADSLAPPQPERTRANETDDRAGGDFPSY